MTTLAAPRGSVAALPQGPSCAARRIGWWLLLGSVLLGHALATLWLQDNLVGWGGGEKPMPPRMEVAFVQALAPAAPPAVVSGRPLPPPLPGKKARAVAPPASAPAEALPLAQLVEAPVPQPLAVAPVPAVSEPPALVVLSPM